MKEKKYLFAYFTGEDTAEGEQVYFAVSADGKHWEDLNSKKPILRSELGERGVRDPFIFRSKLDGKFYIIATDLRIFDGPGWDKAVHAGSTQMILWQSEDLVHWSKPWTYAVDVDGAGCVWAPETIYDKKRGAYLLFWASWEKEDGEKEGKHRIFCSYTKDFKTFSKAEKYIERSHDVIDTTIVEEDGIYYRFSKDEVTKNIYMDCCGDLQGTFQEVKSEALSHLPGVEGPTAFPMQDGSWCLMVDQFATHKGYLPLITKDLKSGEFSVLDEASYDMDQSRKRHGSVLVITDEEYERVKKVYR